MRKFSAIFIAPLVPAILLMLVPVLLTQSWPFNQTDYKYIVVISILVSYFSVLLFGVPILLLLNKTQRLNLRNLSLSGGLAGAVAFTLFGQLLALALGSTIPFNLLSALWGFALGLSVAFVFGLIWGLKHQ
jgi:hypothetical protein